jgi:hypothetical protein
MEQKPKPRIDDNHPIWILVGLFPFIAFGVCYLLHWWLN